jgi:hypothetical protein
VLGDAGKIGSHGAMLGQLFVMGVLMLLVVMLPSKTNNLPEFRIRVL